MDLIAIAQTVRRHKFAALPVLILTFVLVCYVMFLSKPDYQAVGAYALVNPPPAPTQAQITQNPSLGKVDANNPLVSYGNLTIVAGMLTEAMGTESMENTLVAGGVDPRSTVTLDPSSIAPVLTVTGVGSTAADAVYSGVRLGNALSNQLNAMQARLGVTAGYRITAYPLGLPDQASLKVSSKLRDLAGVLALGVILLWVSISIAVARAERKKGSASPDGPLNSGALDSGTLDSGTFDSGTLQGAHGLFQATDPGELGANGRRNGNGARRTVSGSPPLLSRDRRAFASGSRTTSHHADPNPLSGSSTNGSEGSDGLGEILGRRFDEPPLDGLDPRNGGQG
jgi:hypothetical protein